MQTCQHWGNVSVKNCLLSFSQQDFFSVKMGKNEETVELFQAIFDVLLSRFGGIAGCYVLRYSGHKAWKIR